MNITSAAKYNVTPNSYHAYSASNSNTNVSVKEKQDQPLPFSPDMPSNTDNKTPAEQKIEDSKKYKEELKDKETRDKDLDKLYEKQQQRHEQISKQFKEALTNNHFYQIGDSHGLALNKDNYEETVKGLFQKGFTVESSDKQMTISSQLHQLKLEMSKESFNKYVEMTYGKQVAEQVTGAPAADKKVTEAASTIYTSVVNNAGKAVSAPTHMFGQTNSTTAGVIASGLGALPGQTNSSASTTPSQTEGQQPVSVQPTSTASESPAPTINVEVSFSGNTAAVNTPFIHEEVAVPAPNATAPPATAAASEPLSSTPTPTASAEPAPVSHTTTSAQTTSTTTSTPAPTTSTTTASTTPAPTTSTTTASTTPAPTTSTTTASTTPAPTTSTTTASTTPAPTTSTTTASTTPAPTTSTTTASTTPAPTTSTTTAPTNTTTTTNSGLIGTVVNNLTKGLASLSHK